MIWSAVADTSQPGPIRRSKHVGGVGVMRAQIEHIIAMAARPNIAVQVVPNTVGAHAAMENAFTILQFAAPEDPTLVHVETITGDLFMEEPSQVSSYTVVYDHVRASALSADTSVTYLEDLADQLK